MATQKRKRSTKPKDASLTVTTSLMVRLMRRGTVSILEAVAEELPDVFTAEILPKLNLTDTLSLAQVNRAYNSAVWSVDGVRSIEAKVEARLVNKNRSKLPIYWAVKHGNLPAVRALLKSGVDANVDMNFTNGFRLLHVAAERGHTAIVKTLIEAGADVDFRADVGSHAEGKTPLYLAAEHGATLAVIELLKAGADVDIASDEGKTPLLIAAEWGKYDCVSLLIYAGADFDWIDDSGNTAMSLALPDCPREGLSSSSMKILLKIVNLLKEAERVKRACG
jgi:ankyrin repeat protein|tara:strand:+ start:247 stop:1083 length:837 start_codon:yes stop_codon:yes gene_type:complete